MIYVYLYVCVCVCVCNCSENNTLFGGQSCWWRQQQHYRLSYKNFCIAHGRQQRGQSIACMENYYYNCYYLLIWVFHISAIWWSFAGDWVTASLLKSPGLFSVFWPFSIMLLSPTSKSFRPFNNPLVTVPKAPITIGIIVTFMFHSSFNSLARSRYLSLFSHLVLFCSQPEQQSRQFCRFSFFFFFFFWLIIKGLVFWPRLGDPFVY